MILVIIIYNNKNMQNSLFSFKKYQRVILNDSTALMQFVVSLSIFNLPLFFIFPPIVCIGLFGMTFVKFIRSKQFSFSELMRYFVFFISYLFLFPFFFTLLSYTVEENDIWIGEHLLGEEKQIPSTNNYSSIYLMNLFSFSLKDYFTAKYFLKW